MNILIRNKKMIITIIVVIIGVGGYFIYDNFGNTDIEINNEILDTNEQNNEENIKNESKNKKEDEEKIIIHISGEVNKPGIIKTKEGKRVYNIIEEAGGLTNNADISNINLAEEVQDGIKINIPNKNDKDKNEENKGSIQEIEKEKNQEIKTNISNKKVNINTATQAELEMLPGIGPSTALKIIDYRKQNGKFKKIEDIKEVKGIGDSKFEKIRNYIAVK